MALSGAVVAIKKMTSGLNALTFEVYDELRETFENGELRLHYQPKVCFRTGRITGSEAGEHYRNGKGCQHAKRCPGST